MEKNEIYQIQGQNYREMTLEILRASDLAGDIGDRNKYIGIKPNLVIAARADGGAVTHPQIVDGVLSYLKENGFTKIVVLEGSWVGDRTAEAVRVSGILDVCKKHDVRFYDMQRDSHSKKTERGITLNICDEALKLDYLINLPVLKGHCQTYITCALKNMKGLIPNSEKRRFHTMGLHKPIAYLNAVLHQDFILVDNICGDLDFEEGGNPVTMNRLMTFRDPVLCELLAGSEREGASTELLRILSVLSKAGQMDASDYDGMPVYKVSFFSLDQAALDRATECMEPLGKVLIFANMAEEFGVFSGEINDWKINKGVAIANICEHLGADIQDTIAFGDSANDLEMIMAAGLGVAMGNATDDVKEKADYICESVTDDGVVHELKRLKLI